MTDRTGEAWRAPSGTIVVITGQLKGEVVNPDRPFWTTRDLRGRPHLTVHEPLLVGRYKRAPDHDDRPSLAA